jgi:lipopolysaccharide cholinephosphotransferase
MYRTIRGGLLENRELSLREIQKISLDIMIKIDEICDVHNFRYYLCFGSLLGAVRHKGFIPWDDDIDIVMPREDYEQFIEFMECHSDELRPLKLFTYHNTVGYPYMISRVSNDDYYLKVENEKPYGMGIFVDIYPLDGIGNSEKEGAKRKRGATRLSSLCYLSTRKYCVKENTKSKIKMLLKPGAFLISKIVGKRIFMYKLEQMAKKYSYDKTEYIGCLVWGRDGIKGIFPRSWMGISISKKEFEGHLFRVPEEYDKVLTRLYKDYMKLPVKEEQIPHHYYKAYKKKDYT